MVEGGLPIVTADEMRRLEAEAVARGVPEPQLMATAGAELAAAVQRLVPTGAIVVVVGASNNGGDALVAASHLVAAGRPVAIWIVPERQLAWPVPRQALADATLLADLPALEAALSSASAVLDGLQGIGLRRPMSGSAAEAIAVINAAGARPGGPTVIAIDLPSGMMPDSGVIAGSAVRATVTITLGYPKRGLYMGAGAIHAGRIELAGIGLPEGITVTDGPRVITTEQVRGLLPRREATADKRDAGAVVIVGGALNYPGAPRLAALGAMRSGAGYVTLAIPRSIFGIVASTLLETTYLPLPETDGELGPLAAETLGKELERFSAMVVGCGLGREGSTSQFLQRLLGIGARRRPPLGFTQVVAAEPDVDTLLPSDLKLVIDADALNLLSEIDSWHERIRQPAVLTPNVREMARLTGEETEAIIAEPWRVASAAAKRWGQVIVLKKGHSVVATPDGQVLVVDQASPSVATAGSGDVLAGVIGGLMAQGLTPAGAAITALHVGALAAERGAARFGVNGLVASDLPVLVAEVLRELSA